MYQGPEPSPSKQIVLFGSIIWFQCPESSFPWYSSWWTPLSAGAVQSYIHNLKSLRIPAYIVVESTVPQLEEESMTQVHPMALSRQWQQNPRAQPMVYPLHLCFRQKQWGKSWITILVYDDRKFHSVSIKC